MKLSSRAKAFVKKTGLRHDIAQTYLFARANDFPTYYFPDGYEVLDGLPKTHITDEKIDPEWVKAWADKWPKASMTKHLGYAVNKNYTLCQRKLEKFLKQWDKRLPEIEGSMEEKLDLIEAATDAYLADRQENNWLFTNKNHLFVDHETKGSNLEQWISSLKDAPTKRRRLAV